MPQTEYNFRTDCVCHCEVSLYIATNAWRKGEIKITDFFTKWLESDPSRIGDPRATFSFQPRVKGT
jgi:hypothetical protein